MRTLKLLAACLGLCLAVLVGSAGLALAAESAYLDGGGFKGNALVVPAAQDLLGGEQLTAQRNADLTNPVAVRERLASRTRFEGLSPAAAIKLAGRAFPAVVNHPAGGPPTSLPAGEKILSYISRNTARVILPGGHRGALESLLPMATPAGRGHFKPIDLALHRSGNGFVPSSGDAGVQIPSRLSSGIALPSDGVTITPIDRSGHPLGGSSGAVSGASVLYANTLTDTDTLAKPIAGGVQIDALLRSVDSPETLYFRVGMPAGARLVSVNRMPDARVMLGGRTIAEVSAPSASDAAGTSLPVRTSVSGNRFIVTTAHDAHEYQYPIEVDPNAYDTTVQAPTGGATNWHFYAANGGKFESYQTGFGIAMVEKGSYENGERDALEYEAYGAATVMYIEEESKGGIGLASKAVTDLEFRDGNTLEGERKQLNTAGESYGPSIERLCIGAPACGEGTLNHDNSVIYAQSAGAAGSESYWGELNKASVGVRQDTGPEVVFNTSSPKLLEAGERENVLNVGNKGWLGIYNGAFEYISKDPGLGISYAKIRDLTGGATWTASFPYYEENKCSGIWCTPLRPAHFIYESGMVEGENKMEVCVRNATNAEACSTAIVKVDNVGPTLIKLSGMPEEGAELSAAPHQITVEATDALSGIKSIKVTVDGKEINAPSGSCSPGECTGSGTWTINGENLGAGEHKLVVTALDYANNPLVKEYSFAIRNATPVALGPGTLDPESGQFTLSTTDVNIAGAGSVSRTYRSRTLNQPGEEILGHQWILSVGGGQTLSPLPNGNVELHGVSGALVTFASNGKGGFVSPKGDGNFTLESKEKVVGGGITEYLLKNANAGTTSTFTLLSGSTIWTLAETKGTAESETTKYGYVVTHVGNQITEPREILGPVPAGVTCGKNPEEVKLEELKAGCRALTFTYAEKTTATESVWGEYNGRLAEISFTGYNPSSKTMQTKAVAQYVYDGQGRLRAEWDPRISPALKERYGYDNEGHVTAYNPPGQEPWIFTYGTIAGDSGGGRLIKTMRPSASTGLWEGEAPKNTEAPQITGTVAPGNKLSLTNGKWSGAPVAYRYQWEDCSGSTCTPVPGATNANYAVTVNDVGFKIVGQVTAMNGGGAVIAVSASTAEVTKPVEEYTAGTGSKPENITAGPDGNQWFTSYGTSKIGKVTPSGTITEYPLPTSSGPVGIAAGPDGNLWYTDFGTNKIGKMTTSGTIVNEYSLPAGSQPSGIVVGPDGNLWFTYYGTSKIGKITTSGEISTPYELPPGSNPGKITVGPDGNLWFTDFSTSKIGKITTSGALSEYSLQVGSSPASIVAGPDGNLWFTESNLNRNKVVKMTTSGVMRQYSVPSNSSPYGLTVGYEGNLWYTDENSSKLGRITTSGVTSEYSLPAGSAPYGITLGSDGNLWLVENGKNKVAKAFDNTSISEPSPQPGYTVEYRVPLSGSNAPNQMTKSEMAKWGQTEDVPTEATAIFPPDEPMGWPASDYKRALVSYMDGQARTVDQASSSGGISTVEYNSLNEMTRSLSAANRATALKEGSKSAEVAMSLSTVNVYSSDGTQLIEKYGPEHKIRLASGVEEETRTHEKFYYNEEAPEGESHNLETRVKRWLESTSKKTFEESEIKTRYDGQKGLGWKLRKPTLVTSEAKGRLTTTALSYEVTTGAPKETSSSTSSGSSPAYSLQFGLSGTENGQFKAPSAIAVDSHGNEWVVDHGNNRIEKFSSLGQFVAAYGAEGTGALQFKAPEGIATNQATGNVYVTDTGNNRVEELSSEGKFIATYGFGVSNGEAKFQTCTSSCRAGLSGSGNGEFKTPVGVTVDNGGNVWVVDRGNNRIEKFSGENGYVAKYGALGTGEGQFKEPVYIAISAGNLYVTDAGNVRIEELSSSGVYIGQFGSSGTGNGQFAVPKGIAADPNTGVLYVSDPTNSRIEEFSEVGAYISQFGTGGAGVGQLKEPLGVAVGAADQIYVVDSGNSRVQMWEPIPATPVYTSQFGSKGSENGQVNEPRGVAVASTGNVDVLDEQNNRVDEFSAAGGYLKKFGSLGTANGQFKYPFGIAMDSKNNVWVADTGNNRIQEFNEAREWKLSFGSEGTAGGQFKEPKAITIAPNGNIYVSDSLNNRVQEFNEKGEFIATFGFGVSNGEAKFQICTSGCRAGIGGSGAGQLNSPRGLVVDSKGNLWVVDVFNSRVEEFNEHNEYVSQFGTKGSGSGQLNEPKGLAMDSSGNLWVSDALNNRVEEFTQSGALLAKFGDKGSGNNQFEEPYGLNFAPNGSLYVIDYKNNRVEQWTLAPNPGNEGARSSKTIYYSAAANSEYPGCGSHPEWANLVCQTEPEAQPGDSGAPALPVTTTTYNMWDEPETVIEKVGSVVRTMTTTFDTAGREVTKEDTSNSAEEVAMSGVTNEYSGETGALTVQKSVLGGKEDAITSVYNTLGQLTSYTDASGATAKYTYDIDGRVEEMSEPKGRQVYSYDPTTGFMTKLFDPAVGTFTATYDVAGNILTAGYPNGMVAKYTRNSIGQSTGLEYEKTTHCSEKCVWFSDSVAFGTNGQYAAQASSLSTETYSYDESGDMTEVQETPVGKSCTARVYSYNEALERESSTTRECSGEGGVVEGHFYDTLGRLIDPGMSYDVLGNITKMPAVDAGGSAITSSFYVDNQVAVQEQGEKSVEYGYDPTGRTLMSKFKGTGGTYTAISHYASAGQAPTWTCEEPGECKVETEGKWTRNIPGIDGYLDAIQTNGGTPVLQLHDLRGDIVATAADSETETKLLSSNNVTEFGVPVGAVSKYSWFGGQDVASELGTGVLTSGGATYVPQAAQTLQSHEPIPPGDSTSGTGEVYRTELTGKGIEAINSGGEEVLAEQRALELEAQLAGEGEDPVKYLTAYDAQRKASKLEKANIIGEITEAFGSLGESFVKIAEGIILDKFNGIDGIKDWYKNTAELLKTCAKDIEAGGTWAEEHQRCRLETRDYEVKILVIKASFENFNWEARVSWCVMGHKECYRVQLPHKTTILMA